MITQKQAMKSLKEATDKPIKEPFEGKMSIGDNIRQGDVYVTRVESIPENTKLAVPSNESIDVASSHKLSGATVYALKDGTFAFEVAEGEQARLVHNDSAHPNDSHREFRFHQGCYKVDFQTDLLTQRRVID